MLIIGPLIFPRSSCISNFMYVGKLLFVINHLVLFWKILNVCLSPGAPGFSFASLSPAFFLVKASVLLP